MSKKVINVYSLIRSKNLEDIREIFDDSPEIFRQRLKIGKCLFPIEEAIKNESYDIFEFLLNRLPIDDVVKSISKIVYYLEKNNKFSNLYNYMSLKNLSKSADIFICFYQLRNKINGHIEYMKQYFLELIWIKDRNFTIEKLEDIVNGFSPNIYELMLDDKLFKISVENQIMKYCSNERLKEWILIFIRKGLNHNGLIIYQLFNNSDRIKKGIKLNFYEKIILKDYLPNYGHKIFSPTFEIPPVSMLSLIIFFNKRIYIDKLTEKTLLKNINEEMKNNLITDIKNIFDLFKNCDNWLLKRINDGLALFANNYTHQYYLSNKTFDYYSGSGKEEIKKHFEWIKSYVKIGELCDLLDYEIEESNYKKLIMEIREIGEK